MKLRDNPDAAKIIEACLKNPETVEVQPDMNCWAPYEAGSAIFPNWCYRLAEPTMYFAWKNGTNVPHAFMIACGTAENYRYDTVSGFTGETRTIGNNRTSHLGATLAKDPCWVQVTKEIVDKFIADKMWEKQAADLPCEMYFRIGDDYYILEKDRGLRVVGSAGKLSAPTDPWNKATHDYMQQHGVPVGPCEFHRVLQRLRAKAEPPKLENMAELTWILPSWARWIAMNKSGTWKWFRTKPMLSTTGSDCWVFDLNTDDGLPEMGRFGVIPEDVCVPKVSGNPGDWKQQIFELKDCRK